MSPGFNNAANIAPHEEFATLVWVAGERLVLTNDEPHNDDRLTFAFHTLRFCRPDFQGNCGTDERCIVQPPCERTTMNSESPIFCAQRI
jgi:hypothetical protein